MPIRGWTDLNFGWFIFSRTRTHTSYGFKISLRAYHHPLQSSLSLCSFFTFCWWRCRRPLSLPPSTVFPSFFFPTERSSRPLVAPSLIAHLHGGGICVHVKTTRLNGPGVIRLSADRGTQNMPRKHRIDANRTVISDILIDRPAPFSVSLCVRPKEEVSFRLSLDRRPQQQQKAGNDFPGLRPRDRAWGGPLGFVYAAD